MTRSRKRKLQRIGAKWAGLPVASALLAATNVAQAQQAEGAVLAEVVVTAQKRTEDLQKVPISLQVLGQQNLEEHQVASFDDYAKLLPSLSFQSYGPSQAQLYFRGVASGGDGLHAGSLPATGLYLDEIPVTTISSSLDVHMYDIARVEALAGPQGTLYGASSLSGTLRVITNKPDPTKFSAGYDLTADKYTMGDGGGTFEGFVNVPLGERAAVRLVGYYDREGGYIDNIPVSRSYQRIASDTFGGGSHPCTRNNFGGAVTDPCSPLGNPNTAKKNANDVTSYGGRAALKVDLNDNWSITPTILYQHQSANGDFTFLASHPGTTAPVPDLATTDFEFGRNVDQWYQSALTVEGKIGNFDVLYSGGYFERRVFNVIDYADYTLSYDAYGSGYTYFADQAGNNIADPTQYTVNRDRYTKSSHEIRISTPQDARLRAVFGGFLQRQVDDIVVDFTVNGLPANHQVTGHPNVLYLSDQNRVDRDKAVFTELTFDATDKLKVIGGIRKFWVDNTLYGFFGYGPNPLAGDSPLTGEGLCSPEDYAEAQGTTKPCINTRKRVTESGETHKLNLTYQIDADRMVYATYSTGFRPGGNNRRPEIVPYAADRLSNFELGWKTAWFDHRLRVNGALFFEKWKGVQYGLQGLNGITSILNAGNAESKGIEGDVTWAATDRLTLTVGGTYLKAKLTTNFCTAPDGVVTSDCTPTSTDRELVATSGTKMPVTPNFKANATARYKFNVGSFDSFVQGSLSHQSSTTYSLESASNATVGDTPSFTSFDLAGGFNRSNWSFQAYVDNVFDKRGILGYVSQCATDICHGIARGYGIKPRSIGIKFGQKF